MSSPLPPQVKKRESKSEKLARLRAKMQAMKKKPKKTRSRRKSLTPVPEDEIVEPEKPVVTPEATPKIKPKKKRERRKSKPKKEEKEEPGEREVIVVYEDEEEEPEEEVDSEDEEMRKWEEERKAEEEKLKKEEEERIKKAKALEVVKTDKEIESVEKKDKLLDEFYETEKEYIGHLKVIQLHYIRELEQKKILTKVVLDSVFNSLKNMIPINVMFLSQIHQGRENKAEFFKIVMEFSACFKLYSEYVRKYEKILGILKKEKAKNKKFVQFLKDKKALFIKRKMRIQTLQSYLIVPIQRIPRYKLLFQSLLKESKKIENKTKKELAEEMMLEKSFKVVCEIAKHIDSGKEESDNLNEFLLLEPYVNIEGLVKPYRKIVELSKFASFRNTSENDFFHYAECNVYILTDMMLVLGFNREMEQKKKNVLIKSYGSFLLGMLLSKSHDKNMFIINCASKLNKEFEVDLGFSSETKRDEFYAWMEKQIGMVNTSPQYQIEQKVEYGEPKKGTGGFLKKKAKGMWKDWVRFDHIPPPLIPSKDRKAIMAYAGIKNNVKKRKMSMKLAKDFWKKKK